MMKRIWKRLRRGNKGAVVRKVDVDFFDVNFYDYLIYHRVLIGRSGEKLRSFCYNCFVEETREYGEVPNIWTLLERKIPEFMALEMKGVL